VDILNHSLPYEVNHSFADLLDNLQMQGDRVKEVMDEMGWNNADLYRAITSKGYEVTEQAIGKWISGATKNIKSEYFFVIEDLTGFSARWLAEGKLPKKIDRKLIAITSIFNKLSEQDKSVIIATGNAMSEQSKGSGTQ
jgi:uncharacterized protein (UPF0297 family)